MAGVTVNSIQAEYSTDDELISNSNSTYNPIIPEAPSAVTIATTLTLCVGLLQVHPNYSRKPTI